MRGCFAIASDSPRPSVTSCFKSRLTSCGNALGFQMRHAVERDRQRHAGLEQVGQLLGERRQFLQLGLALLLQLRAQCRRQERQKIRLLSGAFLPAAAPALAVSTAIGNKSEPLDLRQGRRPVGHVQDALDEFAAAPARPIGKFCHNSSL